ncbi:exonuclease [Bosea sp. Leaf344]|uniref:lambda exonuclease family protein n=1 Tax=Bosea sp. Leaf344 TaxID=1736346 RepID=UPI0006FBAB6E|nr:lambda exonuclease family protein [Bosea sp. Leaf344]KQU54822.1 exonuclease [Bosea sp. Leaf344]
MSAIEIVTCQQGSPQWLAARLGIPTASEFASIMAKGRGGSESRTRQTYLYKLAGEIITGEPMESFGNGHMERGKLMEEEARSYYEFMTDTACEPVGFIRNGRKGASPDGLIGANGLVEIKTKLPHLLIEALLRDEFPPEHKAQCQGQLWVAEREWIDIAVYWPGMPLFVTRATRDEAFIRELAEAVEIFTAELDATVARVQGHRLQRAA